MRRLNVLGPLTINTDDGHVDAIGCSPKIAVLLASLSFSDSSVSRSVLLERLWPEIDGVIPSARSDGGLDGYASKARKCLGIDKEDALEANKAAHSLILARPGAIGHSVTLASDIAELQRLKKSGDASNLEMALELVRGPVLAGIDDRHFPWLKTVRGQFKATCAEMIRRLHGWPSSRVDPLVAGFMETPYGTLLDALESERHKFPEFSLDTDSVESALAHYYRPAAPSLRTLAQLVVPAGSPFYDTDITLALEDGPDADFYCLTYTLEATTQLDDVVIALTTRASLTDLLLAECPDLTDSFTCSDEDGSTAFIEGLTSKQPPIEVWCLVNSPSGATERKPIPLLRVSDTERDSFLSRLDSSSSSEVILLKGRLPGARGSMRRIAHCICDPRMRVAEHYAFWLADRPTFVRRIVVNAFSFTPPVHIHPMIGNVAYEWEWTKERCDVSVNNWLVKNQGVFLTW